MINLLPRILAILQHFHEYSLWFLFWSPLFSLYLKKQHLRIIVWSL